ncbi:exodeoxyribonuclease III [Solilutibacter silvestris]|uniref:Exodeoxyribonuclease III n=1 Tax=Solilutibacter silvestris TaxID=1645665 RepID=A0A2K1Q0M8_9GAMM|nr:exodeoxyribonuclease III [Lysobacter silvestris]PNS08602.1 exodeoxyribonuclease III [Lysobacter silvestris]
MKIASWNVNSLNVRLPHLQRWLQEFKPDVVGLQETKLEDARFPHEALTTDGYSSVFCGQKTYNGVALLAQGHDITDVQRGIPGFDDPQQRAIAATINGVRIIDLYVVNGEAVGSEKFDYKMRWLTAVQAWLKDELSRHPKLVVMGDFNIAPADIDVHDPKRWKDKVLCSVPEREALSSLAALGLHDSLRLLHPDVEKQFSWWDYRLAAFQRGWGMRIDLLLVSDALKDKVVAAGIDVEPRSWERPSDHTPAWVEFAL